MLTTESLVSICGHYIHNSRALLTSYKKWYKANVLLNLDCNDLFIDNILRNFSML